MCLRANHKIENQPTWSRNHRLSYSGNRRSPTTGEELIDFHTNKKVLEEVAIIPSKRLRNKIVGFSTHLMKRIQKGPVRGISLKLQEEERERRMDFVLDESAIKVDRFEVDKETIDLLASLGMSELSGIVLKEDVPVVSGGIPGGGGYVGYGGGGGAGRRY
ncbi:40S ribosomal protein S17 [Helianthus annuus]|nr:40S ribosomal protein S17 [Helianthus annuus]